MDAILVVGYEADEILPCRDAIGQCEDAEGEDVPVLCARSADHAGSGAPQQAVPVLTYTTLHQFYYFLI